MATAVEVLESGKVQAAPVIEPLRETAWLAWAAKGGAHDLRIHMTAAKLVRWIPIAALLVTAVLWSQIAPYETVVRFIVAVGQRQ